MVHRRRILLSCVFAATAASGAAYGQAPSITQIEELVVTAERREQSLQDVPVAISAFSAERRDLVGINTIQDMTNFTPGLNYTSANDRASLRGIGRLTNAHPIATAVAVYDDGIYTTSTVTAGKTPIFTDRVEVLRGPQGTLYGRNSIGGAINVISKRPTEDFYAEVRGTYANYDHTTLEFAVSGPVMDNLQARLAGNWDKQRDGYFKNLVPGMPSEGGVVDTYYIEAQLQAQFGDNTEVWFKVFNSGWNNGSGGPGARAGTSLGFTRPNIVAYDEFGAQNVSAGFACAPGGVVMNVVNNSAIGCNDPEIVGKRYFATNWAQTVSLDQTYGIALHFTHHFDGWDFRYVGGGLNYNYTLQSDNGGGAIDSFQIPIRPFIPGVPVAAQPCAASNLAFPGSCQPLTIRPRQSSTYREDYHNQSHELNFSSTTDSPLQWIGGLYYYHEGYIQPVFTTLHDQPQLDGAPVAAVPALTGAALPPSYERRLFDNRTKFTQDTYAVYGQLDWQINSAWKATLGLRYSYDELKGQEAVRVLCFATTPCGTTPEVLGSFTPPVDVTAAVVHLGELPRGVVANGNPGGITFVDGFAVRRYDVNFDAVTGTAGIQWEPDPDTMAYFRYGRGYKMGGINSGVTSTNGRFPYTGAEYIDAFDVGLKKNFGRRLQTNVSLFYYPYKNLQAPLAVVNNTGALAVSESRFLNVPKAITKGVEIEATWNPIDRLVILANYSYNDAHIRELSGIIDPTDPLALAPGAKPLTPLEACTAGSPLCDANTGMRQRPQDLKGNSLPQAPKNKIAVNVNYTFEFDHGRLTPSVSYIWRDKQYAGLFERTYNAAPSWDQVDARLTYRDREDRFTAILFVKNLFDELGYDGGSSSTRETGVFPLATVAASGGQVVPGLPATPGFTVNGVQGITQNFPLTPPRTYGIELQYRF